MNSLGSLSLPIYKYSNERLVPILDSIAVEEPLEIRVSQENQRQSNRREGNPKEGQNKALGIGQKFDRKIENTLSVTMRTPGHDEDLALGFLFTEGVIQFREEVKRIHHCGPILNQASSQNIIRVELSPYSKVDLKTIAKHLRRNFISHSSCGLCGKTSLELFERSPKPLLKTSALSPQKDLKVSSNLLIELPVVARKEQSLFNSTGGLHASALFTCSGELLCIREDVGRHNALDKVIGNAVSRGLIPLQKSILLVSGRVSFELVQKAARAGIPILAAVGAPSSLAIELARKYNITLVGFIKKDLFNVYSGEWRVVHEIKDKR